jgi:hypothetical protein
VLLPVVSWGIVFLFPSVLPKPLSETQRAVSDVLFWFAVGLAPVGLALAIVGLRERDKKYSIRSWAS